MEIDLKKIIIFVLILFYTTTIYSSKIDYNTASNIALRWLKNIKVDSNFLKAAKAIYLGRKEIVINSSKNKPYYIFNLNGGGWIIVADDDINSEVLAYSKSGSISEGTIPPQFKWWLDSVSNELQRAKTMFKSGSIYSLNKVKREQSAEPAYSNVATKSVGPLLRTSWGQGRGYNELCPVDRHSIEGNGHVPVGCVATAMGQIMNFFSWPPRGVGSNSYTPASHPEYGRQSVNFANHSYGYSSSDKAKLLYHVGVATSMNYGQNASGTYLQYANNALRKNFRYRTSDMIQKRSDSDWDSRLISSLNSGSPVLYQGKGNIVHVFVCDGYKKEGSGYMYHFNWGWNGRANGWFKIGGMTPLTTYSFNARNFAIFNIHPNDSSYGLGVKKVRASISIYYIVILFISLLFIGYREKQI